MNSPPPLTSAQWRFADEHMAISGSRAVADQRLVFLYREDWFGAVRWLVDEAGRVVDAQVFHRQTRPWAA